MDNSGTGDPEIKAHLPEPGIPRWPAGNVKRTVCSLRDTGHMGVGKQRPASGGRGRRPELVCSPLLPPQGCTGETSGTDDSPNPQLLFLSKIYVFIWKTKWQREGKTQESNFPYTGSLPRGPQQLQVSQAKIRSQKPPANFGGKSPNHCIIFLCLPQHVNINWIGSRVAGIWTSTLL